MEKTATSWFMEWAPVFLIVIASAEAKRKKKDTIKEMRTSMLVTMSHVKGLLEVPSRVFQHHGVMITMRHHRTIKRMLVHPKDKRTSQESERVVYKIPCKDCPNVYTCETGRRVGAREKEDRKDVASIMDKKYTRSITKDSVSELHSSALTDHAMQTNQSMIGGRYNS